jgi:hypothetical protein
MSLKEEPMKSPVRVPQRHASTISSGPMSAGIIQLSDSQSKSSAALDKNESSDHLCMFSVCLIIIGVPLIVVGMFFQLKYFILFT